MNIEDELTKSLQSSFVDYKSISNNKFRTTFVDNDYEKRTSVLDSLLVELKTCSYFWFNVAFITSGGLISLKNTLKTLEDKGVKGEIITSSYLFFNDPKALRDLLKFKNITVKFVKDKALHAKWYIFEHDKYKTMILGSANLTSNALKENKEWNIKLSTMFDGELILDTKKAYDKLFLEGSLLTKDLIDDYERLYNKFHKENRVRSVISTIKPNMMQSEALLSLEDLRNSGETKALLISATGTGKTYLSAFDVASFNPKKILFLVHKENILEDALSSFKRVIGEGKTYGICSGTKKEVTSDFLFSTIQTMTKDKTLELFDPSEFDYLIIDEAHHSEASTYKKIIDYFNPKFTLGMTATPERNDTGDIFKLFDNNIAYEIRLEKALEANMLVPFHYFGVTDIINIEKDSSGKDILPDFNCLVSTLRVNHIISTLEFYGYSGNRPRGLIFCSNQKEAIELSNMFNDRGFKTKAVVSSKNSSVSERILAVKQLESNDDTNYLDYLFVVDIFNEGVDIPSLNQIVMLRKTDSAIIYIQQLGRVLRKYQGKEYAVVIDFISNYQNNFLIPIALLNDKSYNKDTVTKRLNEGSAGVSGASTIEFDEISKDRIFESLRNEKSLSNSTIIKKEYNYLKNKLGHIPTLMDFYNSDTIDPYVLLESTSNYHNLIKKVDKTVTQVISKREDLILSYFSSVLSKGITVEEVLILKELILKKSIDKDLLKQKISESSKQSRFDKAYQRANASFMVGTGGKKYKDFKIFEETKDGLISLIESSNLNNTYFKDMLLDYIDLALKNKKEHLGETYKNTYLVLYNKYTRLESAFALDLDKDYSATVFGYKIYKQEKICPIFVTYNKDETMIQEVLYEDTLLSNKEMIWFSRPGKTKSSPEISDFINETIIKHMFIKKDTNDKSFYYLGSVSIARVEETKVNGKNFVKFLLLFDTPIREDIFNYLNHKISVFDVSK